MKKEQKAEFIIYVSILVFLILIVFFNNKFWKLGKEKTNNTVYLESNNIIYNVPYEEEWLE